MQYQVTQLQSCPVRLPDVISLIFYAMSSPGYGYKSEPSYVLPNYPESYTQQEEKPHEHFKEVVRKYFEKHGGPQMAFKEEVEVEADSGKLYSTLKLCLYSVLYCRQGKLKFRDLYVYAD